MVLLGETVKGLMVNQGSGFCKYQHFSRITCQEPSSNME